MKLINSARQLTIYKKTSIQKDESRFGWRIPESNRWPLACHCFLGSCNKPLFKLLAICQCAKSSIFKQKDTSIEHFIAFSNYQN